MLRSVGFEVSWSGDGSDDTLQRIKQDPPGVVVLCAQLEQGDSRSLASAVRARAPDTGIVLVGETEGPVRNALDAIDYDVDRFVGRPLAPKALRFAVKSAAKAVETRAGPAPAPELVPPEPEPAPPEPDPAPPEPDPAPPEPDPPVDLPPPREPTLILSDGGASSAAPRSAGPEEPTAPQPAAPGSDLARELRAKMSKMAQRLFPDRADDASAAVGVDPHSEIDLAALGSDTVAGQTSRPYAEVATADTYADDRLSAPDHWGSEPGDGSAPKPELQGVIDVDDRRGEGNDQESLTDEGIPPSLSEGGKPPGGTTQRRRASSSGPMRGDISSSDEDVASLLARLYKSGFSGRVVLRHDEAEKVVHFDEGRPVFATSNLPHDRMGDLLYREGKITRAQHARSREVVAESGRRMGEILVDKGFLKRRELLPAVRRHIEDIIYSLFAWESGEYTMIGGESAASEKIRLSRHPAAVIVEGIRRKYGLDVLEQRIGSADHVVGLRDEEGVRQLLVELDLGQIERRAIQYLDGEHSLAEVSELADVDLLGVYQICFGLIVLGVADTTGDGVQTDVWTEAARSPALVGATDLAIDRERLLAKHAHVDEADYFTLLGVRREASGFEIQRAYESARRDYAAESFPHEVRRELATEIDEINGLLDEAYTVLRDDGLREAYRSNLLD